jgi:hypothetical protein
LNQSSLERGSDLVKKNRKAQPYSACAYNAGGRKMMPHRGGSHQYLKNEKFGEDKIDNNGINSSVVIYNKAGKLDKTIS